jgi:hypothetical protein
MPWLRKEGKDNDDVFQVKSVSDDFQW